MDPRIARLSAVEQCKNFEENAERAGDKDLAKQARVRATELRAEAFGATTRVEFECLQAVYAYEEALSRKNKKRTSASRTWQMIRRLGILAAVERAVDRPVETMGFTSLVDIGLQEFAFEAIILRNPDVFGPEAVLKSRERMEALQTTNRQDADSKA